MKELLYTAAGIVVTIIAALFIKLFGAGKKTETPLTPELPKPAQEALVKGAEAIVKGEIAKAQGEAEKEKLKKILEEPDPVKRLHAAVEAAKDI